MRPKVLFICKKNESYSSVFYGKRSGLYNSTRFIAESLVLSGVDSEVVEVIDNNDIDREVAKFKPTIVVIEALWVVPEKFHILKKLHPTVKWFVHLHSNAPFLAMEGIAIQWVRGYEHQGVGIIVNSDSALEALKAVVRGHLHLLHNVYLGDFRSPKCHHGNVFNVGCFGAIRPMKNQLTQALAAIKFARHRGLYLRFHVNASRSEGGDPVLKNLRALFHGAPNAELVEVPWLSHAEFLKLLHRHIDMGLQVSLSETFNIVTADCVTMGLPVVTSNEVGWISRRSWAGTDSVDGIVKKMNWAYNGPWTVRLNQFLLEQSSRDAQEEWLDFAYDHS